MKKLFYATLIAGGLAATSGSAATFNFAANADGTDFTNTNSDLRTGGEADWATIVGGAAVGILDVPSGISVVGSATGTTANGTTPLFAYFDSGSAGLGVCGNTGSCSPSNDDNVGALGGSGNAGNGTFESLILTFNRLVEITQLVFAAEGHGAFTGTVRIDGNVTNVVGGILDTSLIGSMFTFDYIPVSQATVNANRSTNEFYIEAVTVNAVPVPGALPLLLAGLGGLGVMARRKRRTA